MAVILFRYLAGVCITFCCGYFLSFAMVSSPFDFTVSHGLYVASVLLAGLAAISMVLQIGEKRR